MNTYSNKTVRTTNTKSTDSSSRAPINQLSSKGKQVAKNTPYINEIDFPCLLAPVSEDFKPSSKPYLSSDKYVAEKEESKFDIISDLESKPESSSKHDSSQTLSAAENEETGQEYPELQVKSLNAWDAQISKSKSTSTSSSRKPLQMNLNNMLSLLVMNQDDGHSIKNWKHFVKKVEETDKILLLLQEAPEEFADNISGYTKCSGEMTGLQIWVKNSHCKHVKVLELKGLNPRMRVQGIMFGKIVILNCHLGMEKKEWMHKFEELQELRNFINTKLTDNQVIIAGDFNTHIDRICPEWTKLNQGDFSFETYIGGIKQSFYRGQLDKIFVVNNQDITMTSCVPFDIGLKYSDHIGLAIELDVSKTTIPRIPKSGSKMKNPNPTYVIIKPEDVKKYMNECVMNISSFKTINFSIDTTNPKNMKEFRRLIRDVER